MSTVLITGGAGFIGRHLVRHYLAAGNRVVVVDDLSTGDAEGLPSQAELVQADVADPSVAAVVAQARPSLIVHAAAQVSVARSMQDPQRDLEINVLGTRHVVTAATGAKLVFTSTGGAIYGEADGATEETLPRPANYYGIHKWAAERYVVNSGLPYAIVRLANVYGPGQRPELEGGVVAIFCQFARESRPLPIHGSGDQRRDFVHVYDVIRAITAMAQAPRSGTWNVGTGLATSINELAELVERAAGVELGREWLESRTADVSISRLNPTRAKLDLGWRAEMRLADAVPQLLAANRT